MYKPVSGAIYFNDELSTDIRYNHLRRQIGFVTQDTQLFAGTIKDNLLFVKPDATDEEITEAFKEGRDRPDDEPFIPWHQYHFR